MKFTVILDQESDGGNVAIVPTLPGCVSQGDSREEALANIREAAELYIEDCIEAGDPVPTESGREFIELTTRVR
jgi:predicted RNase H-like HicB family nuclease